MALLVCYRDALRKLLGTAPLSVSQLLLAIAPAVLLFALWEIGKLATRHRDGAQLLRQGVELVTETSTSWAPWANGSPRAEQLPSFRDVCRPGDRG